MVADPATSFIGLEFFVTRGDSLWEMTDAALIELGAAEAETLGLFAATEVRGGTVVRMPKAYPVYDAEYTRHLQTMRAWLDRFDNAFTVGRNGQHRYNNQDHSMLTGLYAARSVGGDRRVDVWAVNEDETFQEEVADADAGRSAGDRLTPAAAKGGRDGLEVILAGAFQRYDEVAFGGAIGITAMALLGLSTALLLLEHTEGFVPMLSLLGNYLFGYEVSWRGLLVGLVEVGVGGFGAGWTLAKLINLMTAIALRNLERRLAALTTLDAVEGANVDVG
jgi:hypothetical protein